MLYTKVIYVKETAKYLNSIPPAHFLGKTSLTKFGSKKIFFVEQRRISKILKRITGNISEGLRSSKLAILMNYVKKATPVTDWVSE